MELKFFHHSAGPHPVVGEVFYDMAQVSPGQEGAQRYELYVCSVLDAVAQTPASCDRLLGYLASVLDGTEQSICAGGNDVVLNIDTTGVQVDISINDDWIGQPESKFTLQEWQKILESWKYLLEMPKGSDEVVLVQLT
ncbi:hypothetical protein NQ186_13715 [Pseudomonas zeae]|uniref:hypothetical protein n=1 Tax=Pseudomonas TaxID=286 RepID=UPI0008CF974C|nr:MULTISPECIES: hypothetical protein [Pseudomonas]UUT15183.1 hypothetical protein NQ186_13715 [Pseudomonas zeae]SEO98013.1 hypothetical protein SAMN04487856_112221 [Pseudomonas sp. ok266]